MTWEELTEFCRMITEERKQIRESRGIQPPRYKCPDCGSISQEDIHAISIRSALFVLNNNGVVSEDEFKELDKQWKKYRKENELDSYGNKKTVTIITENGERWNESPSLLTKASDKQDNSNRKSNVIELRKIK